MFGVKCLALEAMMCAPLLHGSCLPRCIDYSSMLTRINTAVSICCCHLLNLSLTPELPKKNSRLPCLCKELRGVPPQPVSFPDIYEHLLNDRSLEQFPLGLLLHRSALAKSHCASTLVFWQGVAMIHVSSSSELLC